MALDEKLARLPDRPGVYIYKDAKAQVIYVGKAASLRSRVRSYFQESRPHDAKTDSLVRQIADLEYIVTDNELEALMLEANLVRKHRPRYNIILRDDKHYPFLKLTTDEDFPRLVVARRVQNDGATYYGPFYPATAMRETLRLTRQLFPLRTCSITIDGRLERPCIQYAIHRCNAPCTGWETREGYAGTVKDVAHFLEGKNEDLLRRLTEEMERAAGEEKFERAAVLRDQIQSLKQVQAPQRGGRREYVAMAESNAAIALQNHLLSRDDRQQYVLEELRRALNLPGAPNRIEGYDISNIQGTEQVGSMVVWENGDMKKDDYKRFKIRTVSGADDFGSLREVLGRRFGRALEQGSALPDLVLIDGGRGQLNVGLQVLQDLGLDWIPVVALAKQQEEVYAGDRREPLLLDPTSPALHTLQKIRDEAHRFAITYHKKLRGQRTIQSALDAIPGVGPTIRTSLLKTLGSARRVRESSVAELAAVPKVTPKMAQKIYEHFHPPETAEAEPAAPAAGEPPQAIRG